LLDHLQCIHEEKYEYVIEGITHTIRRNYPYHWKELLIPLEGITHSIGRNYSYHWKELPIPLEGITHNIGMNYP